MAEEAHGAGAGVGEFESRYSSLDRGGPESYACQHQCHGS